ncbi:MAG: hypothetical protein E4G95_09390 [Bacteroidia bacterium]|nr:MAG: hypothetical protein E4G95_09390 [Bacteroidia bacterium]
MKNILAVLFFSLLASSLFAQDDYPIDGTFETGILFDVPTIMTPYKGMLEFQIHHRFGMISDGIENLWGIYSSANVRLGLNYAITDRLMVGVGTTRGYKLQDFQGKYQILRQTQENTMPVSLAFFGNMAIEARTEDNFGPEENYKFMHRISYFSQLIVARKFNDRLSLQAAPTLIYFNAVETGYMNLNYGVSAGGRFMFAMGHSFIVEYDQLLNKQEDEAKQPKPQLAFGWEKSTPTHSFQLFFANYTGIIGQHNFLYNQNDFTKGDYLVGLNITVRF